jgi:hypothetical protein
LTSKNRIQSSSSLAASLKQNQRSQRHSQCLQSIKTQSSAGRLGNFNLKISSSTKDLRMQWANRISTQGFMRRSSLTSIWKARARSARWKWAGRRCTSGLPSASAESN